jgi:hypothetical protein
VVFLVIARFTKHGDLQSPGKKAIEISSSSSYEVGLARNGSLKQLLSVSAAHRIGATCAHRYKPGPLACA